MKLKFPNRCKGSQKYDKDFNHLLNATIKTLEELGWMKRSKMLDSHRFKIKRPLSFWSWGEIILIDVQEDEIHVKSRSKYITQWYDFGQNKRNVTEFFKTVKKYI